MMATNPNGVLSTLDVGIETLDFARESSSIAPAKTAFELVGVLLKTIKVGFFPSDVRTNFRLILDQEPMVNQQDYIALGLSCAEICEALDRGTRGKRIEDLNQPVHQAINQLMTWVELPRII